MDVGNLIKVKSSGFDTKVFLSDGTEISQIKRVYLRHDCGYLPSLDVECHLSDAEFEVLESQTRITIESNFVENIPTKVLIGELTKRGYSITQEK